MFLFKRCHLEYTDFKILGELSLTNVMELALPTDNFDCYWINFFKKEDLLKSLGRTLSEGPW